jgi:outer membrane protein assembly factor BamB
MNRITVTSRSPFPKVHLMKIWRATLLVIGAFGFSTLAHTADSSEGTVIKDFAGIWIGEITTPMKRTELGLAFTSTPRGLLVSLHFPEMFLNGTNFGPASFVGDRFELAPLHLTLSHRENELVGSFGLAKFPVTLRKGGTFPPPPVLSDHPAAPAPSWTQNLGANVWASPVAADGVVYVGTIDGYFHAINAHDGTVRWVWKGTQPCYAAALVTADSVYFVDDQSALIALRRADGSLAWRTPLVDTPTTATPTNETFNHRTATPVIDAKGVLYVAAKDGGISAIKATTGKILWRHDAKAAIYAPLTLLNDRLLAACFDGSLFELNLRTRQESKRIKLGGPIVSAPVVTGNHVIVGSRDYLLYGLSRKTHSIEWTVPYWFSWVESTPRLADGVVYIGGSDYRRVSAFDPSNGKERWSTDVRGLSWGSPVVTTDSVYAGTAGQEIEGTVIKHQGGIVALDRATGSVRWRYGAPVVPGAKFNGFVGSLVTTGDKVIGADVNGTMIAFPIP